MSKSRIRFSDGCTVVSAGAALILLLAVRSLAHDSPEHVIEQLTAQMAARGTNAESLWERATEYRSLGRLASAARDLAQAARLRPDFLPVLADLALVEQASGKASEALATLGRALQQAPDERTRGGFYMARADLLLAQGDFAKALADAERAFRRTPEPEPDWYLTRGQLQARLGHYDAAVAGLQRGFELTGHPVLEAEWIDALLDAGRCQVALDRIEPRLVEARCQSSWLVRRARARLGLGQPVPARGDLHTAITEITSRLNPVQAEPTLLAERGFARALLGDQESARQDLKIARARGAEAGLVLRLERAVAGGGLAGGAGRSP
jgi:tetratricopeptide (TPR) repeat protein